MVVVSLGSVAARLLDDGAVASGELLHYPGCDVLGSGVEGKQFVEIAMVEIPRNGLLHVLEVFHHSLRVQLM